jgi:serine/threonine protein kinase
MLNLEILASSLGYKKAEPLIADCDHVCDLALLDGRAVVKYASDRNYQGSCTHLMKEQQAMRALSGHPNYPKFISFSEDTPARLGHNPIPILLREFVVGRTSEAEEIRDSLRLYNEIIAAIKEAHRRGYSNLDIKGTNIIITPEGKPVIIDLGMACWVERDGPDRFRECCRQDFWDLDRVFLE